MEVRAKKALGQHFLTDQSVARSIVAALSASDVQDTLEIGPGMGVLSQYLLAREDIRLKMVEVDGESVVYLRNHFPGIEGKLLQADYLKLDMRKVFPSSYKVIGNFPYNISSQIFFKILEDKDLVPEVVCMIQKEVAERMASAPGSKVYGVLSVLIQAWYDVDYLFTVHETVFNPPPKVKSAVVRLTRNSKQTLGCNERLFRRIVKTVFTMRRKMMRNGMKQILPKDSPLLADPIFNLRPEQLSVDDFINLTNRVEEAMSNS